MADRRGRRIERHLEPMAKPRPAPVGRPQPQRPRVQRQVTRCRRSPPCWHGSGALAGGCGLETPKLARRCACAQQWL